MPPGARLTLHQHGGNALDHRRASSGIARRCSGWRSWARSCTAEQPAPSAGADRRGRRGHVQLAGRRRARPRGRAVKRLEQGGRQARPPRSSKTEQKLDNADFVARAPGRGRGTAARAPSRGGQGDPRAPAAGAGAGSAEPAAPDQKGTTPCFPASPRPAALPSTSHDRRRWPGVRRLARIRSRLRVRRAWLEGHQLQSQRRARWRCCRMRMVALEQAVLVVRRARLSRGMRRPCRRRCPVGSWALRRLRREHLPASARRRWAGHSPPIASPATAATRLSERPLLVLPTGPARGRVPAHIAEAIVAGTRSRSTHRRTIWGPPQLADAVGEVARAVRCRLPRRSSARSCWQPTSRPSMPSVEPAHARRG